MLRGSVGAMLALAGCRPAWAPANAMGQEAATAGAGLPWPHITTTGEKALGEWERLRREGHGWPVVVGSDDALALLAEIHGAGTGDAPQRPYTPEAILAEADKVRLTRGEKTGLDISDPAAIGKWPPAGSVKGAGLSVALDMMTGKPLARAHILLLPARTGAEAPAWLRWGGWNECPMPAHHVAILRDWNRRYGAELVGMSGDVLNLRVTRRPKTREEALLLAREQYEYCVDIVDQGVGSLAALASALMEQDWWFFWWD